MNSDASNPALIGIDWGTSSLRAFLISAQGDVLDKLQAPDGIMQVKENDFDGVLSRLLDLWPKTIPLLASGMITSRNGWLETPYIQLPAGAGQIADVLVPWKTNGGLQLHFVTGVTTMHKGAPDVIRGEETQIIGAVESGLTNGLFVMPGTHSKWVTVRDGSIVDFATYMSGEIFAALRHHTILGTLMTNSDFNEEGFIRGVQAGFDAGAQLLHSLFHVRTMPLFELISEEQVADYLSGMLIGAEIKGASTTASSTSEQQTSITIVGRDDLADRYAIGLRDLGYQCHRTTDDIVAHGHFAIATAAGLIK